MAGAQPQSDLPIDGVDIGEIWFNDPTAQPRKEFHYYFQYGYEAIRQGDWKLHVGGCREGELHCQEPSLYNLSNDIGETTNVYADYPEIVAQLTARSDAMQAELGDSYRDQPGPQIRPWRC